MQITLWPLDLQAIKFISEITSQGDLQFCIFFCVKNEILQLFLKILKTKIHIIFNYTTFFTIFFKLLYEMKLFTFFLEYLFNSFLIYRKYFIRFYCSTSKVLLQYLCCKKLHRYCFHLLNIFLFLFTVLFYISSLA